MTSPLIFGVFDHASGNARHSSSPALSPGVGAVVQPVRRRADHGNFPGTAVPGAARPSTAGSGGSRLAAVVALGFCVVVLWPSIRGER